MGAAPGGDYPGCLILNIGDGWALQVFPKTFADQDLTAIDGYRATQNGRAGLALDIPALIGAVVDIYMLGVC